MTVLLNLIWLIFGGMVMACAWAVVGVSAALTIIGLPWAGACFRIANFTLWPFGREAVDRRLLTGRQDAGTSDLGVIGNVLWLVTLGLPLAAGHVISAIACGVTIIGIPFAWQHLKLAAISLWPIGTEVVDVRIADEARRRAAFY